MRVYSATFRLPFLARKTFHAKEGGEGKMDLRLLSFSFFRSREFSFVDLSPSPFEGEGGAQKKPSGGSSEK